MTFEAVISTLTIVSTFGLKLIGFPDQIRKIRQAGSIEGVSVLFFVLGFISYLLWTIHGITIHDNTVIYGQGLGVVANGILLSVMFYTSRKEKSTNQGS